MYREVMAKKFETMLGDMLLQRTTTSSSTIILLAHKQGDPTTSIQGRTRTITNREHRLQEVIISTTITVVEVLMFEVQAAEVRAAEVLLQDQVLAPVHRHQVEEINNHTHSN